MRSASPRTEDGFIALLLLGALAGSLSAVAVARAGAKSPAGHDVYMHSGCFACHGELGYGGAGPALRGDKMLAAGDFVAARILLGGTIMPAFGKRLSDEEIAAVASYVRTSWGNDFGPLGAAQVAQARKALGETAQAPQSPGESP